MNKSGVFEEVLEKGGSAAKQTGKAIAGSVSDVGRAAASQITGQRNNDTQDIVASLYGKSDNNVNQPPNNPTNQNSQQPQENTPEAVENKKKLEELRQQLHREVYYDPLVNPKKPQEEERPAEKVEKEKQEEMMELEEKNLPAGRQGKLPTPLIQKNQQRVEKFPGASG